VLLITSAALAINHNQQSTDDILYKHQKWWLSSTVSDQDKKRQPCHPWHHVFRWHCHWRTRTTQESPQSQEEASADWEVETAAGRREDAGTEPARETESWGRGVGRTCPITVVMTLVQLRL